MEKRVRLEGGEPCPPPPSEDSLADLIKRLDELIRLLTRLLELPSPTPGFDGRLDELVKFTTLVPFDWGKATGGNLNTLIVAGKNWATNIWAGSWLRIIDGTGRGQVRIVASNTLDRVVPETPFAEAPDATSVYVLWRFTFPANVPSIRTFSKACTFADQAYQGDDMVVPEGMFLIIKSHPANATTSLIRVAGSASEAINPNFSWPLVPNEAVAYQVKNANQIYISSNVAGSIAIFSVEGME